MSRRHAWLSTQLVKREGVMKKTGLVTALFLATSLLPHVVSAQLPGLGVHLVPKVGVHRPLGDFADGMKMDNKVAIGLAAELHVPLIPFGLRANVDYSSAADIKNDAGARVGSASLTHIVGDLVFHPVPGIIPIQPYFFAGGGVKRYKFRDFTAATFNSGDNRSDPTLHVGAGVELHLLAMGVLVEAGDYISRFDNAGNSKLQNDGFGMIGIRIGL
jgi:hypothetical protein